MTIEQALHLIPSNDLFSELRSAEEDLLADVNGAAVALRVGYRMVCHYLVTHRRFPEYHELPARLRLSMSRTHWGTVDNVAYRGIVRRTKRLVLDIAEHYLVLHPYMQCRLFNDENSTSDIEDRIAYYRRENARLEKEYDITPWTSHATPVKRAVYSPELDMTFSTAKKAASYVSERCGRQVRRNEIRTAIVRGYRCGEVQAEPEPVLHNWCDDGGPAPDDRWIKLTWRYADNKPAVKVKASRSRIEHTMPLFQAA